MNPIENFGIFCCFTFSLDECGNPATCCNLLVMVFAIDAYFSVSNVCQFKQAAALSTSEIFVFLEIEKFY